MKRNTLFIILLLAVNVAVLVYGLHWRAQRQKQAEEVVQIAAHAERYSGMTGPTISAFDERTDRWIAEMKAETVEVVVQKLTDGAEYFGRGMIDSSGGGTTVHPPSEEEKERLYYYQILETILSNRRFRKAYEDLQMMDKKQAAELLTKNTRENLAEMRKELQKDLDTVTRGEYRGNVFAIPMSAPTILDDNAYRPMSSPDYPQPRFARRYAVFSYVLLASLLELSEVRPAVEEVIELAKEEYKLFCSLLFDSQEKNLEVYHFRHYLFAQSLYHPSLLVTATLCDPTWNTGNRKRLEAKLVNREVVDWQARSLEYDMPGWEGLVPLVPHEKMLKIRYYQGVTDEEFNDFFGK